MAPDDEQRFLRFVDKAPCGCWLWTGAKDAKGYGFFSVKHRPKRAHRLSYSHFNGVIGPDEVVRHKCDTPSCVNPDHLETGTPTENMQDAIERGRFKFRAAPPGEEHHKARLTNDAVRDIRTGRLSTRKFAKLYGVSQYVVWAVTAGRAWRHVA